MMIDRQQHMQGGEAVSQTAAGAGRVPSGRNRRRCAPLLALACSLLLFANESANAQQRWPLWDAYTARFLDGQGRVIDRNSPDQSQGRTTSEGEAYALFFSLVQNDRPRFEQILHWTEQNLAGGDLTARLPGWNWGKASDGGWKLLDSNPASDADLWIAYSLLEAGRLWQNPHYTSLGSALAARIAHEELVLVPGLGVTLIAGARGFHPDPKTWILNPSYLPPPLLIRMAQLDPSDPWSAALSSLQPLLVRGSGAGYAMDWVLAGSTIAPSETPAQLAAGVKNEPAVGSYDAIRVYLWLGISNPATPNLHQLLDDVSGMSAYLKTQPLPPERVDSTGKILGPNGSAGFSAAVAPFLAALGRDAEAKAQLDRATRDPATGIIGQGAYYDQNLALFASGWFEQRFRFDPKGRLVVPWKARQP